jgi:predicted nucleic acid-binding protein
MNILVDTSIWSLSLRKINKNPEQIKIINQFKEIIKELRVKIIGPIRQEILSGIKDINKFENLKDKLKYFTDDEIITEDYEEAANLYNLCRSKGIQGSHIDFLICAISKRKKYLIFTLDKDFENYSKIIDIKLYKMK